MIIRRRKNKNYTVIGNEVFDDERLSLEATGLLCYLRSRPNDWHIQLEHLRRRWGVGREKMQALMRELIAAGWVLRQTARAGGRGTFAGIEYVVLDEPQAGAPAEEDAPIYRASPQSENPTAVPESEKPESGEPESAGPESENPTPYKVRTLPSTESLPPNPPVAGGASSLFESWEGDRGSRDGAPHGHGAVPGEAPRARRSGRPLRRTVPAPALTAEAQARYSRLETTYPADGVRSARHLDALAAFGELSGAEQDLAIRAAATYADTCRRTGQHVRALHNWLRQGCFRNGAAPAAGSAPPVADLSASNRNEAGLLSIQRGEWPSRCTEFVAADSPEGAAWEVYLAGFGVKPRWCQLDKGMGWNMPSRMPPAVAAA